jgi:hypothetical protein
MSLSSLFIIVWMLMLGHGSAAFAGGFLLVMSTALLFTSLHDILTKKRQGREAREPEEIASSFSTKELSAPRDEPVASVTETTTKELKVKARARKTGG